MRHQFKQAITQLCWELSHASRAAGNLADQRGTHITTRHAPRDGARSGMSAKKRIACYTRQPACSLEDAAHPRHAHSHHDPNTGRRSKQSNREQVVRPTHLHAQLLTGTQIGHCKRAKQHARRCNGVPNRHTISSYGQQRHRPSTAGARATYSIMEHGSKVFRTDSLVAFAWRALQLARTHGAGTNA